MKASSATLLALLLAASSAVALCEQQQQQQQQQQTQRQQQQRHGHAAAGSSGGASPAAAAGSGRAARRAHPLSDDVVMVASSTPSLPRARPPPLAGTSGSGGSSSTPVSTAAAVPALIGADGPELTQVAAAQALGLSGKGVKLCVIDTGVDIGHPTFGAGCPSGPDCRVAFSYDVESKSADPMPSDLDNAGGHGTHVAGIALGGFPEKLLGPDGRPLPYQTGVAPGAMLGAVRASTEGSEFPYSYTIDALKKTAEQRCDIDNLSLGGFHVTPNEGLAPGVDAALDQGVVVVAAQGNDEYARSLGNRLFNGASPGNFPRVLAVGHMNNTANPGALLEVDVALPQLRGGGGSSAAAAAVSPRASRRPSLSLSASSSSSSSGGKSTLTATQRADVHGSIGQHLQLPLEIILIKVAATAPQPSATAANASGSSSSAGSNATAAGAAPAATCQMKTVSATAGARSREGGQVVLFSADATCKPYFSSSDVWGVLRKLSPALVLLALPQDQDAHTGPLYARNGEVPAMWLAAADGAALAAAIEATPERAVHLTGLPGAAVVPLPADVAGAPALTSSVGPAYDLSMKPDVSAPGSLYSSLPNSGYQTWPGTSMASPYLSGVVALWMEAVRQRTGGAAPPQGWIAAAHAALKNTARPVPFRGAVAGGGQAWPPAKVGAGVVQAHAAVLTRVSVAPTEVLLRTDAAEQAFTLRVTNDGARPVTYALRHLPAVTMSLPKSWYNRAFDAAAPVAEAAFSDREVTVAPGETAAVNVTIAMPPSLRAMDGIVSGYVQLVPRGADLSPTPRSELRDGTPIALSVPYQGSSRDYSTIGAPGSLALFATPLPDVDRAAAELLAAKPVLYVCDYRLVEGKCSYNPDGPTLKASELDDVTGVRLASALVRPVADVRLQVWSADGATLLGTSASLGPGPSSPPMRRAYLGDDAWDGSFTAAAAPRKGLFAASAGQLRAGQRYRLKAELHPVLAAGDRAAGREQQAPFVYELPGVVKVESDGASLGSSISSIFSALGIRRGDSKEEQKQKQEQQQQEQQRRAAEEAAARKAAEEEAAAAAARKAAEEQQQQQQQQQQQEQQQQQQQQEQSDGRATSRRSRSEEADAGDARQQVSSSRRTTRRSSSSSSSATSDAEEGSAQ